MLFFTLVTLSLSGIMVTISDRVDRERVKGRVVVNRWRVIPLE